jgi:hypothetical protein
MKDPIYMQYPIWRNTYPGRGNPGVPEKLIAVIQIPCWSAMENFYPNVDDGEI